MGLGLRQRGVRVVVLAGYFLAATLSGLWHDHSHATCCHSHTCGLAPQTPTKSACGHSHSHSHARGHCHHGHCHHGDGHECGSHHSHGPADQAGTPDDTDESDHNSPGHSPENCASCRFLAQAPLLVTFVAVEAVTVALPHLPPPLATQCGSPVAAEHPARGPPA